VIDPHPEAGDSARRLLTSWCFSSKVCTAIERHLGLPEGRYQDWLFDRKRDSYDLVQTASLLLHSDTVLAAICNELMKGGLDAFAASRQLAVSKIMMKNYEKAMVN
jgi:hypothetical protein